MSFDGPVNNKGNRHSLTFNERDIPENSVLPTARRWLRIPSLRSHAVNTLEYWGENYPQERGGA